jgi:[protein-PII] uridylyltransferase
MSGRVQKHALERLNFVGEVSTAERLAACKTFIRLESAMMRMHHDAGESGLVIARARAAMVDVMLGHLFDYAMMTWTRQHGSTPSAVALLALGGYGRAELSPFSDIDIMFLFPSKAKPSAVKPLQEHLVNEILYVLWDCGIKVGHSTRTVDDVFAEARKDIQTKTALLESRLIARVSSPAPNRSTIRSRPPTKVSITAKIRAATSPPGSKTRAPAARNTATPFSSKNPTSKTASAVSVIIRTRCGWRA